MLTGNLLSIGIGGIITVGWSLISPADFDWEITRAINIGIVEQDRGVVEETEEKPYIQGDKSKDGQVDLSVQEAVTPGAATPQHPAAGLSTSTPNRIDPLEAAAAEAQRQQMMDELDIPRLKRAFRFAAIAACSLTFILIFAIPLPLFFSSHSKSCFLKKAAYV